MNILFIHQNFPGQFRQLAPYLISCGHTVKAICSHGRPVPFECDVYRYPEPSNITNPIPGPGSTLWVESLQRASAVAEICSTLSQAGWKPDRICAHTGWGETLGLREVWPDVPQIVWPELWLLPIHGGHGVDPTKPPDDLSARLLQIGRNSLTRAALSQANSWVLPTKHQARSLPLEFQDHRLHIIHEGIDVDIATPRADVHYEVRGVQINRDVPTITFVNRNLERLRGFDVFMEALPSILYRNPNVRVLIVGDENAGYGGEAGGKTRLLNLFKDQLDLDRVYFLGRIPYPNLIGLLQTSWVHIYLSYPFILGWSLLEAMACGCCIVGSRGFPVEEVLDDGVDGLLVPIHDPKRLADRVTMLLNSPELRQRFSLAARNKSLQWDRRLLLPALSAVVENSYD